MDSAVVEDIGVIAQFDRKFTFHSSLIDTAEGNICHVAQTHHLPAVRDDFVFL